MGILLIILGSIVLITGFIMLFKLLNTFEKRPCRFILLLITFIFVIDCIGSYMVGTGIRKVMHLDEKEKIENRIETDIKN